MPEFQRPRGTRDFSPDEMERRRAVEEIMRTTAHIFSFKEITTPTFEHTNLFTKRSGEAIIGEMYTFKDKSGRDLSLRPELTAPTMRFYAERLRNLTKPVKVFYFGNCFRYERPQSGRFREFWQFGAEIVGGSQEQCDAEIIALAVSCLKRTGLEGLVIRIGHLGILRHLLKAEGLDDSEQNKCMQLIDKGEIEAFLEILGGKIQDKEKVSRIQSMVGLKTTAEGLGEVEDSLSKYEGIKTSIGSLKNILRTLSFYGIEDFTIDLGIARGLDYYTGMVFEIDAPRLGAEKQVCGGGAYTLAEMFGVEPISSTGFAIGFDRVLLALEKQGVKLPEKRITTYIIPMEDKAEETAFSIASKLRESGISTEIALARRSISKEMKRANAINAKFTVIIGEDELVKGTVTIKNMASGEQQELPIEKVVEFFRG